MKVNIKKILVALVIINSFFLKANAQFSPADPGGDPGDVPIDDYLFPMLVFGFFLGIYFTYKNRNQSLTNNVISEITTNAGGALTQTSQLTYQYNSQDYPLNCTRTDINYQIGSNPSTSTTSYTFTYY